jgi:hypothetical protein
LQTEDYFAGGVRRRIASCFKFHYGACTVRDVQERRGKFDQRREARARSKSWDNYPVYSSGDDLLRLFLRRVPPVAKRQPLSGSDNPKPEAAQVSSRWKKTIA